jgi:hypothetical protein
MARLRRSFIALTWSAVPVLIVGIDLARRWGP